MDTGYYGYAGKVLQVNLTDKTISEKLLDLELARSFLGDYGINAMLAYDLIKPGIDPMGDDNVIIIGAGPLTGTNAPSSGRTSCFIKYPVNGAIDGGGGGMGFGARLKYAGYDHLIISGRSPEPVYITILNGEVEIRDASHLWGKDTYEVTDRLWEQYGSTCSVLTIGQGGENLSRISLALINKSSTIGKGGLGSVMGAKNLKAIVANGRQGVRVYDTRRFREAINKVLDSVSSWPERKNYVAFGHILHDFDALERAGGYFNYWRRKCDPALSRQRFGPDAYFGAVQDRRVACFACPVACQFYSTVKEGPYAGMRYYSNGPVQRLAERLELKSITESIRCNQVLQRYGLDYELIAGQIEFARDLYQRGVINRNDTEGEDFAVDVESTLRLIEKIAFRKGFGDVLADGMEGMVNRFGKDILNQANQIKGVDLKNDPRATKFGTVAMDNIVGNRGPTGKGGYINPGKFDPNATLDAFLAFGKRAAIPDEAVKRILDTPLKINIARLSVYTQSCFDLFCSLGLCIRLHVTQFWPVKMMAETYSAATGIEMTDADMLKAADRIHNVVKMLNVREGFSRKDDVPPFPWFQPAEQSDGGSLNLTDFFGTRQLTAGDVQQQLDDFYDERGWDKVKGVPTRKKLIELGLAKCLPELEKV